MATSREEWESGTNGARTPEPPPMKGDDGNGRGTGAAQPGTMKPGRPGAQRPDRPGADRSPRPRFEGMRLKLRKATSGRYALGVEIELGVDAARARRPEPEEEMEALAPEDDEDEAAFAAEDDGEDGDHDQGMKAFAAEDDGEDEQAAFAAEDQGGEEDDEDEDEDVFAEDVGEDEDEGAGAEDDGEGETTFTAEDEDDGEPSAGARWPNQLPVRKGVLEISQAPAFFEDPDDDDDDLEAEDVAGDEDVQDHEEAAATIATRGAAQPAPARPTPARPMPPRPTPHKPAAHKPAPHTPALHKPARTAHTVKGMLAAARRTIGIGEHPPGSDHNRITDWYNKHIARIGNGPWCNMAVTYWAGRSKNLRAIFAGPKIGYAYTVAHAQKFRRKGRWRDGVAGIKPGDVVFFDWNGTRSINNIDHVGVVEKVKGKRIVTIEGNTTGDRCRRMVRDAKFIVGYGRPAYGR
jgi:hypothetical protein